MRRQITWLVALTSTAIVFSFLIPLGLLVRTLAQDRAMAMGDQEARSIAIIVSGLHDQPQLADQVAAADQRLSAHTSVLLPDGQVLGHPAPGMASDPEVLRARAGEAFSVTDAAGGRIYVPVVVETGTIVVVARVSPEQLTDGVSQAWSMIAGLGVALTGIALLVASRMGASISAPLGQVADTAHRLREGDLAARAPATGTAETVELGRALNGLADRIGELLAAERSAVGDLAHRLRTPVTALRLEAESVQPPERADRLAALITSVQAGIDGVVREARRDIREDLPTRSDLAATVAERLRHWSALAEDQGRHVEVAVAARPVWTAMSAADATDLIDILLDNVFAHTEEGVGFRVSVRADGGDAELVVADDGPGFPGAAERGEPRVGSTGLGLDIVRRAVAAAGGRVAVSAAGRAGATVSVRLPLLRDGAPA